MEITENKEAVIEQAVEQAVEQQTKKENEIIINVSATPLSIVQQLAAKSGELANLQGEYGVLEGINSQLTKGLDDAKAELVVAKESIAAKDATIAELTSKVLTIEAELAKQLERAERAEKCLSLQAYQDVHAGTKQIEDIAAGDGSTVVQQWRAIKDKKEKLKFYREHAEEIMKHA